MNTEDIVDSIIPTPENENSIDYLCHHLDPLQMACVIHFLRHNAKDAGDEAGSYRQIEQIIYKNLVADCGPEDASRCLDKPQP